MNRPRIRSTTVLVVRRGAAREAAIEAVRRIMPLLDLEAQTIPPEVLDSLCVSRDDFVQALKRVQPSAMREVMVQVPNVGWDDVGGVGEAEAKLREGIELPLKHPEAFHRLGIRPAKGFLLYGPPGTGKTLLAKAVAKEAEANFISVKSSDLLSKWYGESEQQLSRLFARARQVAPCVIFIDEIDSLVPARGTSNTGEPQVTARVVNTILAEMDGMEELNSIVLIGATNRPALVDPALLRPGRLDELIYVGTPDAGGRELAAIPEANAGDASVAIGFQFLIHQQIVDGGEDGVRRAQRMELCKHAPFELWVFGDRLAHQVGLCRQLG